MDENQKTPLIFWIGLLFFLYVMTMGACQLAITWRLI